MAIYTTTQETEVKEEDKAQNFKFIFLFLLLIVVVGIVVAGVTFLNEDNSTTPTPNREDSTIEDDTSKTIYKSIEDSDEYKKLEELIIVANLAEVLQSTEGEYTIFAPTDAAFEEIVSQIEELENAEDTETLRAVLMAHIIEGKFTVSELANETEIQTMNENVKLQVSVENGELKLSYLDSSFIVFSPDIETSNGYIQVVDKVLLL